ncbi:hypothetical protein ADUPG1_012261, partial [Aduncisulcus paluster]
MESAKQTITKAFETFKKDDIEASLEASGAVLKALVEKPEVLRYVITLGTTTVETLINSISKLNEWVLSTSSKNLRDLDKLVQQEYEFSRQCLYNMREILATILTGLSGKMINTHTCEKIIFDVISVIHALKKIPNPLPETFVPLTTYTVLPSSILSAVATFACVLGGTGIHDESVFSACIHRSSTVFNVLSLKKENRFAAILRENLHGTNIQPLIFCLSTFALSFSIMSNITKHGLEKVRELCDSLRAEEDGQYKRVGAMMLFYAALASGNVINHDEEGNPTDETELRVLNLPVGKRLFSKWLSIADARKALKHLNVRFSTAAVVDIVSCLCCDSVMNCLVTPEIVSQIVDLSAATS